MICFQVVKQLLVSHVTFWVREVPYWWHCTVHIFDVVNARCVCKFHCFCHEFYDVIYGYCFFFFQFKFGNWKSECSCWATRRHEALILFTGSNTFSTFYTFSEANFSKKSVLLLVFISLKERDQITNSCLFWCLLWLIHACHFILYFVVLSNLKPMGDSLLPLWDCSWCRR